MKRKGMVSMIAFMLLPAICRADGLSRMMNDDGDLGWLLVGLLIFLPPYLSVLFAFLSFRFKSDALNVLAWITVSIHALYVLLTLSLGLHDQLLGPVGQAPHLLALSLGLLISKRVRETNNSKFLSLKLLVSTLYLFAFNWLFAFALFALHLPSVATEVIVAVAIYVVQGVLVYRLVRQLRRRSVAVQGSKRLIQWSVMIGTGVSLLTLITSYNVSGYVRNVLFHFPYPNIFTGLICWIIAGVIVAEWHKRRSTDLGLDKESEQQ